MPLSRRRTADRRPDRRHRGSSHSPSEPGGKRCSALAFLEPLLQPEVGLALCVHRHCSAAAREKFQKLPIEAGSGVAAIAGSASFKSSSTMREPVGQPPSSYREWPTDTADRYSCSGVRVLHWLTDDEIHVRRVKEQMIAWRGPTYLDQFRPAQGCPTKGRSPATHPRHSKPVRRRTASHRPSHSRPTVKSTAVDPFRSFAPEFCLG